MSLRFWRRVRLLPGVRLNLSKRGASVSVGRRGAWLTLGRRPRITAGLPGTGLSYTRTLDGPSGQPAPRGEPTGPVPRRGRGCLFWLLVALGLLVLERWLLTHV